MGRPGLAWRKEAGRILALARRDPVPLLALGAAALSSLAVRPRLSDIDPKVLACLFSLMFSIRGAARQHLLDAMAARLLQRCHSVRSTVLGLTALCFFLSMLVTNDVALLALVPLALVLSESGALPGWTVRLVVLMTLAANLGSALTPMGNPQNLLLYTVFDYTPARFLLVMAPVALSGGAMLLVLCLRAPAEPACVVPRVAGEPDRVRLSLHLALFALSVLSVLGFLPWIPVLGLCLATGLLLDRPALRAVDWSLLATFVGFFLFAGNVSRMEPVQRVMALALTTPARVLGVSALLSQGISNVPAAALLSGLTDQADALSLGVNIGGSGTLVASLASVIAYKLYRAAPVPLSERRPYLPLFTWLNLLALGITGLAGLLWLRLLAG